MPTALAPSWKAGPTFAPRLWIALLGGLCLLAAGCGRRDPVPGETAAPVPIKVRLAEVRLAGGEKLLLSGEVRARVEMPLAFQVPGRILVRLVQAGQTVRRGEPLFQLDASDYEQQVRAAEAQLRAAEAEAANAASDRGRLAGLAEKRIVTRLDFDRVETRVQATRERVEAALAALALARNNLGHTRLTAPADGLLLEVIGEAGQVVGVGMPVARLAQAGAREVEVSLPQSLADAAPAQGRVQFDGHAAATTLELREVAGTADPISRTWRARYLLSGSVQPPLGSVLRVELDLPAPGGPALRVPIGALDERGGKPRIWTIGDGLATAHPVEVLQISGEEALIRADLRPGTRVIAVGTHVIQPGLPVSPVNP
jgi:RND family efflux transporter MFP subunit